MLITCVGLFFQSMHLAGSYVKLMTKLLPLGIIIVRSNVIRVIKSKTLCLLHTNFKVDCSYMIWMTSKLIITLTVLAYRTYHKGRVKSETEH